MPRRVATVPPMTEPAEVAELRASLAEAQQRLAARPATGRPPHRPKTAAARLIARVMKLRGITKSALAAELGVSTSLLSRANTPAGLADHHQAALRAMLPDGGATEALADGAVDVPG